MFAIELVMPVVSPMSLLYVALSCITATYVGRSFFGVFPSFDIPSLAQVEGPGVPVSVLPWFVLFGLLLGLTAWVMTRGIYWFEDFFDSLPGNYYTRHMSGMLLVGLIVYGFMSYSTPLFGQPNHYYVQGVGYATAVVVPVGQKDDPPGSLRGQCGQRCADRLAEVRAGGRRLCGERESWLWVRQLFRDRGGAECDEPDTVPRAPPGCSRAYEFLSRRKAVCGNAVGSVNGKHDAQITATR